MDKWDWWLASGMVAFWYGVYQISPAAGWMLGGIFLIILGASEGSFGRKKGES